MEKIINTLYGDVTIRNYNNGLEGGTFIDDGWSVYDPYDGRYLGDIKLPWFDEASIDEHLYDITALITDALDNDVLFLPCVPDKEGKGIWVLNVLESYGVLPPTAKANLYSEEKDVLSAKDDVVHEKLDEFAKNNVKYELMDERGITELRSVEGDIYICITYCEKEVK